MPGVIALKLKKDGAPLCRLSTMDPKSTLADLRINLTKSKSISDGDVFVDPEEYPIPLNNEKQTKLEDVIKDGTLCIKGKPQAPKQEPLAPPTLTSTPAHNVDTLKEGMTDLAVSEQTLKLPGSGPMGAASVSSAADLTLDQWKSLLLRNNLFSALNFSGDYPKPSFKHLLRMTPAGWQFSDQFSVTEDANVTSSLTYTARSKNYVESKVSKEEASASYAFCSASFENENKTTEIKKSTEKTVFIVGKWNYNRCRVQLNPSPDVGLEVCPEFVAAVDAALASDDAVTELHNLCEDWGHVYPTEVFLGGQLFYTDSKRVTGTLDEKQEESRVSAALQAKVGSASGKVGMSTAHSTSETQHDESQAETISFQATGGNTLLAQDPGKWTDTVSDYKMWRVTQYSKLKSVFSLLDPERRKKVSKWVPQSLLAKDSEPKVQTAYQVPVDSLLVATLAVRQESPRGFLVAHQEPTQSFKTPHGYASVHFYPSGDRWITRASLTLPVQLRHYFMVNKIDTYASPEARCYLYRFVGISKVFGDWQPIDIDKVTQAAQDGLVVCTILNCNDGCRGEVFGQIGDNANQLATVANAAIHYNTGSDENCGVQSICMPVLKGSFFSLKTCNSSYIATVKAWLVPFGSSVMLGKYETRDSGVTYSADTDGFIVATLHAQGDGNRAFVEVHVSTESGEETMVAGASFHFNTGSDTFVQGNSVTLPVVKGSSYYIDVVNTSGCCQQILNWIPMTHIL